MKSMKRNILVAICIGLLLMFGNAVNPDMVSYYRGLGQSLDVVETNDLLKAADDWRNDIIPQGLSSSITTVELLSLADEWRVYPKPTPTNVTPSPSPSPTHIIATPSPSPSPTPIQTNVQLKTGTVLKNELSTGQGSLEIENKVDSDTVISLTRLTDQQTSSLKVYIRAGDNFIIRNIPDNLYVLYYMSGNDWNSGTNKFNNIVEIAKFDSILTYDLNGNYWIATLYPVEGGNAPTTNIPESDFPN